MRMVVLSIRRSVSALMMLFASSGCYNAANHAMAQSVEESFKQMHISASLNDDKALSRELLQSELEVAERQQRANRDLALAEALDGDWNSLRQSIHDRATELFGKELALSQLRPAADAIFAWNEQRGELQRRERQMAQELSVVVTCPLPQGENPPADAGVKEVYDSYQKACAQSLALAKQVPRLGGDLGEIRNRVEKEEKQIKEWRKKSLAAGRKYVAAMREYKKRRALGGITAEALNAARTAIVVALQEMEQAGPAGQADALDARVSATEALIAEHKKKGAPKAGPETPDEVLATSNLTTAQIRSSRGLAWLELEAARLRGKRKAAHVKRRSVEARLRLLHAEEQALYNAAFELADAFRAMEAASKMEVSTIAAQDGPAATSPPKRDLPRGKAPARPAPATAAPCVEATRPVVDQLVQSSGSCKKAVARALIHYGNVWTLGRIPAAQARWMALGSMHEEAINESIATMEQWEDVLEIPISQLAIYHASGVKPDALVQLVLQAVQALGIGAIAASVAVPP